MRCRNEVIHFRLEEYMKTNHKIQKRQIGAIAIAMITGTGLILGILLSLLCYQLGMYKDQSKKEILNNKYDLLTKYYEATIMSEINKKKDEDAVANKKKITNFKYSVFGVWNTEIDAQPSSAHLYHTTFTDTKATRSVPDPNLATILQNNITTDYDGTDVDLYRKHSTTIDQIQCTTNGLLYYRTKSQYYFPVRTVEIPTAFAVVKAKGVASARSSLTFKYSKRKSCYVCVDKSYENLNIRNYIHDVNPVRIILDDIPYYTKDIEMRDIKSDRMAASWQLTDPVVYWGSEESQFPASEFLSKSDAAIYYLGAYNHPKTVTQNGSRIPLQMVHATVYYSIQATDNTHFYSISSKVSTPVDTSKHDLFAYTTKLVNTLYPICYAIPLVTALLLIALLGALYQCCHQTILLKSSGKPSFTTRIPLLVYLSSMTFISAWVVYFISFLLLRTLQSKKLLMSGNLLLAVGGIVLFFFLLSSVFVNLGERLGTKTFRKYTVCHGVMQLLRRIKSNLTHNLKWASEFIGTHIHLAVRIGVVWIVLTLIELFVIGITDMNTDLEIIAFAIYKVAEALFLLFCVEQFTKLTDASRSLAEDALSTKLDTSKLFGPFRRHAETLNRLQDGIQIAVQDKMKSERFRTELITNVSHDIKTPLTSIINYVDLLKADNLSEEEKAQYLDVLDRQSGKLKKLIENLIEASKASTGNLTVCPEPCNLNILLAQTAGEFTDKLTQAGLELIIRKQQSTPMIDPNVDSAELPDLVITADSRHLWRIFDNLMGNICKYSQPGTRVYIDLATVDQCAQITFRNTSQYPLEQSTDALLERFVRGDSSRSTQGNGLGLSIAKNLAELMNGTLALHVDGDLFKVIVTFPLAIEEEYN